MQANNNEIFSMDIEVVFEVFEQKNLHISEHYFDLTRQRWWYAQDATL